MWLRRRNLAVVAELLLPPLGLAALELGLRLRDVRGELRLLLAEPLLELGQLCLALLELVGADLDVRLRRGLAELESGLALVQFLHPVVDRLLHPLEALLAAVGALLLRVGHGLVARELVLALGQRLLALLEAGGQLLEVATAVGVALLVGEVRLEPVQLRLARGQVELALVEVRGP